MTRARTVTVVPADAGPLLDLVEGDGTARALIWPGMGAELRSMHLIRLAPGTATRELRHPSDAVYAVVDGSGEARELAAEIKVFAVSTGSMVHIDGGTAYRLTAGETGLELIGGPAPFDPGLYRHLHEDAR